MYIENLLEKKLKNLNEKFNLKLIFPLYLSEDQKDKIKKIFILLCMNQAILVQLV